MESMNLQVIQTLNSWPLCIVPVHSLPAMAKANRLAVEHLQKKRHRTEETTEERTAYFCPYPSELCARVCVTQRQAGHILDT